MPGNVAEQAIDAQRAVKAAHMRRRGAHWNEIADRLGYPSPAAALKAVDGYRTAAESEAAESAEMLRHTANGQLDDLVAAAWGILDSAGDVDLDGNVSPQTAAAVQLRAVDELRRLVEAKVKLNGAEVKAAVEVSAEPDRIELIGLDPRDVV